MIVKDEWYSYFGAWSGISPRLGGDMYAGGSTGVAILRRDGFASVHGDGTLTTKPVSFDGKHLFVNTDARAGELRVEVVDQDGQPIGQFTESACVPLREDSTSARVRWRGGSDLSKLSGGPVRFRFRLKGVRLYSFWVTPDPSGASRGYVTAAGPGFSGATDAVEA